MNFYIFYKQVKEQARWHSLLTRYLQHEMCHQQNMQLGESWQALTLHKVIFLESNLQLIKSSKNLEECLFFFPNDIIHTNTMTKRVGK